MLDRVITDNTLSLPSTVKIFQYDITDEAVEEVFQIFKPEVVNHHAASIHVADSFQNPSEYENNNVLGTIKLLELGKKYQIKQFIFPSTAAVYGDTQKFPIQESDPINPQSFYGLNKFIAEQYIKLYSNHFITTIFRYANVYGPRQASSAEGGVVAIFAKSLSDSNSQITINGDGNQTRDFIYVKDIAKANLLAIEKQKTGIFHVSSNYETSINQLYESIQKILKTDKAPQYGPKRDGDIEKSIMDNALIISHLGWKPQFTLDSGLKETVMYFNN